MGNTRSASPGIAAELDATQRECARLWAENQRLKALLCEHGLTLPSPDFPPPVTTPTASRPASAGERSVEDKIALFRHLFHGRTDVYPVRWESRAGKSGYSPACGNEWRPGVCEKPRIKCSDCDHRLLLPLTDQVIYDHLAGRITAGVYPLLADDTCHFLAVDFDDADWREDARAFAESCQALGVPVAVEISRSGRGAHAWIFFTQAVTAREARRLGSALISYTCARHRQLKLASYDRLFPNQDVMPKGGFGNLIALPLQKKLREEGHSVFVNADFVPHPDQWAFLASMERLPPERIEMGVWQATGGGHPLDVAFIPEEDPREPWKAQPPVARKLPGPLPERLAMVLANQLYFPKSELPQALANRLIRLAAFQNPEFYRAQAMRLPVWNKPRVIGCAENYAHHIALPRGCLDAVLELLADHGIHGELRDERYPGEPLDVRFAGTLRPDQTAAIAAVLAHDTGVLCAPTAFGKTVTAAALIARRGVNTLVLVHRTELARQWRERLRAFLDVGDETVGMIGGGQHRPTGGIDIAVMQSLSRKGEISTRVEDYGQIIVDECHHLSASSFEAILKRARAKYVLGLTATPVRRDGQHPIIFMQCGPLRHTATTSEAALWALEVWPRHLDTCLDTVAAPSIQALFRQLAENEGRNARIVADVLLAYRAGRRVILLTERTEHLEALRQWLAPAVESLFILHGRLSRRRRAEVLQALEALPGEAPRVLLATGRLIGEGFDHPPLDTLVLAMPIAWRGTLQQYAGRLHRAHASKRDVRILDYVDGDHPVLRRMWDKRQRGYRAMGYRIIEPTHNGDRADGT